MVCVALARPQPLPKPQSPHLPSAGLGSVISEALTHLENFKCLAPRLNGMFFSWWTWLDPRKPDHLGMAESVIQGKLRVREAAGIQVS